MPENTAALTLRGVTLSAQHPAVVVPVTSAADAPARAAEAVAAGADVVEWRIDLAFAPATDREPAGTAAAGDDVRTDLVSSALPAVRAACGAAPLLVTYRTTAEGGSGDLAPERYVGLVAALAAAGADAVDIEADHPAASEAAAAIRRSSDRHSANRHAVARPAVVLSHHDFDRTPDRHEIVDRLAAMEAAGADVAKIAVMPRSTADVLTLLAATAERAEHARIPLVTMSMGDLGAPTRLVGGRFGSAATFASVAATSAPGQLPVADVRAALDALARAH